MGMFKDLRDIHKMSKQYERPSLSEALSQSKQALEHVQQTQGLAQQLSVTGIPAQATIKSLNYTGRQINNMPELQMSLSVDVNGFKTEVPNHVQVISPAMLGSLTPGAVVSCRVEPTDHSKLILGM